MEKSNDIEVADVEHYKNSGEDIFNYEFLVMKAISKCIEAGSHEMRAGFTNEKHDFHGNVALSYIEDARKKYIETVKTLLGLLVRVYDKKSEENINTLFEMLDDEKKKLLNQEWKWYVSLAPEPKKSFQGRIVKGLFNSDLGWYQKYIEFELEVYRDIFVELMKLIKRRDDFKSEDFEV